VPRGRPRAKPTCGRYTPDVHTRAHDPIGRRLTAVNAVRDADVRDTRLPASASPGEAGDAPALDPSRTRATWPSVYCGNAGGPSGPTAHEARLIAISRGSVRELAPDERERAPRRRIPTSPGRRTPPTNAAHEVVNRRARVQGPLPARERARQDVAAVGRRGRRKPKKPLEVARQIGRC
jgi:hypothetical protein